MALTAEEQESRHFWSALFPDCGLITPNPLYRTLRPLLQRMTSCLHVEANKAQYTFTESWVFNTTPVDGEEFKWKDTLFLILMNRSGELEVSPGFWIYNASQCEHHVEKQKTREADAHSAWKKTPKTINHNTCTC